MCCRYTLNGILPMRSCYRLELSCVCVCVCVRFERAFEGTGTGTCEDSKKKSEIMLALRIQQFSYFHAAPLRTDQTPSLVKELKKRELDRRIFVSCLRVCVSERRGHNAGEDEVQCSAVESIPSTSEGSVPPVRAPIPCMLFALHCCRRRCKAQQVGAWSRCA